MKMPGTTVEKVSTTVEEDGFSRPLTAALFVRFSAC